LALQFVHAADVAAALTAIVSRRAGGAFNLATDQVIDRDGAARVFGGLAPPPPLRLVRGAITASWHARLQPIDGGWIDLAAALPLLRSDRARRELDWTPAHAGDATLLEFLHALRARHGHPGPLLHPRRLLAGQPPSRP
jgi:nucleoside-diphosphate-sugar epimerase